MRRTTSVRRSDLASHRGLRSWEGSRGGPPTARSVSSTRDTDANEAANREGFAASLVVGAGVTLGSINYGVIIVPFSAPRGGRLLRNVR